MNIKKMGLLPRVIIAIILGAIFGFFLPDVLVRIFVTFKSVFSEFLSFVVPLIVIGLVVPAIADLCRGAGKLLVLTAILAYGSTVFSGYFTYFSSSIALPNILPEGSMVDGIVSGNVSGDLTPFFTVKFPPAIAVMSGLILSFLIGLGLAFI